MRSQVAFLLSPGTTGTPLRGFACGAPPRREPQRQIRRRAYECDRAGDTAAHDGRGCRDPWVFYLLWIDTGPLVTKKRSAGYECAVWDRTSHRDQRRCRRGNARAQSPTSQALAVDPRGQFGAVARRLRSRVPTSRTCWGAWTQLGHKCRVPNGARGRNRHEPDYSPSQPAPQRLGPGPS